MEDQSTPPSGVNADGPAKPRRAHRMPTGKARRSVIGSAPAEGAGDSESAPADDVATDAAITGEANESTVTEANVPAPLADSPTDDTAAETADEPTGEPVLESEDSTPVVLVEPTPPGKKLKLAVAGAAALLVAAAGFAGATVQPYLADRATAAIKQDVSRTAASAITTLWTYTPDDMEALPDRASQFLSGDFEDAYRKYVDGISATNKQAQVSNDTQVLGAAVESINAQDASAIVYTNSTATSPLTKGIPSLRYVSYRLTMVRHDATWLVSSMSTITSLDLTPQL